MQSISSRLPIVSAILVVILVGASVAALAGAEIGMPAPWRGFEKQEGKALNRTFVCQRPKCRWDIILQTSLVKNQEGQSCLDCPAEEWQKGMVAKYSADGSTVTLVTPFTKTLDNGDQIFQGELSAKGKDDRFISNRIIVRKTEVFFITSTCQRPDAEGCRQAMAEALRHLTLTPES